MKSILDNNTLTIFVTGRITSDNSDAFARDCFSVLEEKKFDSLILDCADLNYISSSGLRVLLKLSKTCADMKLINVNSEIYEVLVITGFSSFLKIEKALRKISIENAVLIGEGYFSKVYRIDNETIAKVYIKDTSLEDIKRELNLAKQSFILGIPTAISYDIALVEGKYAVIFELLNCQSLRDSFKSEKKDFEELTEKYAGLLLTINTTETKDTVLPDAKIQNLKKLEKNKALLPAEKYSKLEKLMKNIPEKSTFIHGDCHVKNIMDNNGELMLIDMDTLSKGYQIFELGNIFATYSAFVECGYPQENFYQLTNEAIDKIYDSTLQKYLTKAGFNEAENNRNKIAVAGWNHMLYWLLTYDSQNTKAIQIAVEKLSSVIEMVQDLVLK